MNSIQIINSLSEDIGQYIEKYNKILIASDKNIEKIYNINFIKIQEKNNHKIFFNYNIESNEASKDFDTLTNILDFLSYNKFNRKNDCILVIGGGVVGDLFGFAASIYMRGIDYFQIPTSLLAMVDSSIGGKTGINTKFGKNMIGSFYFPKKILLYIPFLKTLPRIEFINGFAEIIKIAAIYNKELWEIIKVNCLETVINNNKLLTEIIRMAAQSKIEIVTNDTFEKKDIQYSRDILNFGHTIGHAIEASTFERHGLCVSIGMIYEMRLLKENIPITSLYIQNKISQCLKEYELPVTLSNNCNIDDIIKYINYDKKGSYLISLTDIGKPVKINFNKYQILETLTNKRELICDYQQISKPINHKRQITIDCPGSKSETNRVLLIAAMGKGQIEIKNILLSDDTIYMIQALINLGIKIQINNNNIIIEGCSGVFNKIKNKKIFLGNSGTCVRFLTACISSCVKNTEIIITGDKWMKKRPINILIDALCKQGVNIVYLEEKDHIPFKIISKGTIGNSITINGSVSSQYISAIMMMAPYSNNSTTIIIEEEIVSFNFIKMTSKIMERFGIITKIRTEKDRVIIEIPTGIYTNPLLYNIEADASSCIYPISIAILNNYDLTISNLYADNIQGDSYYCTKIIEELGVKVEQNSLGTTYYPPKILKEIKEIDMDSSDTFITFCILCCFINGKTIIKNISNQNKKECKRIDVILHALLLCGVNISREEDNLIINGCNQNLDGAYIECHDDHRIAMSIAVFSTRVPNIVLSNYMCVNKTYPSFWSDMGKFMLKNKVYRDVKLEYHEKIKKEPIFLIGMPGVGKTTLGKQLADKLQYHFIDLDSEIELMCNCSCKEYIIQKGWDAFRELENIILNMHSYKHKDGEVVISTGGGIIESEKNRHLLKSYSCVIFVIKSIQNIEEQFYKKTYKEIWESRFPYYFNVCSHIYYDEDKYINIDNFLFWFNKIYYPIKIPDTSTFLSFDINNILNLNSKSIIFEKYDAIELRVDLLESYDSSFIIKQVFNLINISKLPIIYTVRTVLEGGKYDGSYEEIKKLCNLGIMCGCSIIDIELYQKKIIIDKKHSLLLGSIHSNNYNYIKKNVLGGINKHVVDIIKVVTRKGNIEKIQKILHQFDQKKIILANNCKMHRLINTFLTPVKHDLLKSTANTQLTIEDITYIRNKLQINNKLCKQYYLFGYPIDKSPSPEYHNNFFKNNCLLCNYSLFPTQLLLDITKKTSESSFFGASVTTPFKESIVEYMDVLSDHVKEMGALNTILKKNDKLVGYNTDYLALNEIIQNLNNSQKYGLEIGTGGASIAACYVFKKQKIPYYLHGRNEIKMKTLQKKFNAIAYVSNIEEVPRIDEINVVIIAVPSYVHINLRNISSESVIIELAYGDNMDRIYPHKAHIINGKEFLYSQAKYQTNLWINNQ